MQIVWADDDSPELCEALINWTSRKIWPDKPEKMLPDGVALGVFENGNVAGCCVYHDWDPDAGVIELSSAAADRRWLTRPVLKAMFEYPFLDLGCQMVVTRVSANERQAHLHRIFRAFGFKEMTIPRLFGRDEDGILFLLTDDDWKASKFFKERAK